ncbi:protein transport protein Sec16A isoform X1 [Scleropages formosus]|uniref:Protein transport protein sec16 n=1 Tax=Scleropages formosus TaxID=113540 RepID=A0A8C9QZE8_SCLFO|nr:protein transport protein Sec16A isoform X1 [Scleropages formosus]XP_018608852.2 protein transport protein Sec16A isoform X1 [Scleropages formosus]
MMQPPPRTAPPGAVGPPPPSTGVPNAFRRPRAHKHPGSAIVMPGPTQPVIPMTDPFAFGLQAPSAVPTASHPPTSNSSPLPMQTPPPASFLQTVPAQSQSPQLQEGAQAPHSVPLVSSLSSQTTGGNTLTPNIVGSSAPPPYTVAGFSSPGTEEGYFNTKGNVSNIIPGALPHGSSPTQSRPPHGQDPALYVPSGPSSVASHPTQWIPDHGSRPPSVQNYFQPTTDHSSQALATLSSAQGALPDASSHDPPPAHSPHGVPMVPYAQAAHAPQATFSPHTTQGAPSYSPSQKQSHSLHPGSISSHGTLSGAGNSSEHHNSQFLAQNYFSQNCTALDPCFNQPQQEQFYHQMAGGPSSQRHESAHSPQVNPPSHTGPTSYVTDPGTVSMFFKENDVENEETLTGERKAVNGVPSGDLAMPYLNDSGFIGGSPKLEGSQFDHVENLECVPNQEVLPNEPHKTPLLPQNVGENLMTGQGSATVQGGGHFETGPNLETPDSVPRPARPESVSSGYSNVSHGSVSGARRPQGVVGTFIQQEVPRLSEDSSAGYFEQIDTSPAVEAVPQNAQPRVGHGQPSQPLTPSPPKPTGIFQASANSSFEPVHSHSVGVKPFEVDQARMVAEKNGSGLARVSVPDISPGNLEQPPDNMENIFMAPMHHPGGVPPERRPSSRAHGARLKCESPATTLWAQTELPVVGTNIMLAPAAPPVLGPLKQPSTEVIQPPEDGPLDLQATQADPQSFQKPNNSMENLENPPKLGETGAKSPQASLGYASLLVPSPAAESFQNQPILIAPPATNYNVIPPNNSTPVAYQMVCNESVQNPLPVHQSSESTANTASVVPQKTNHLEHFASSDNSSETLSGRPAVNHSPLDLAPESRHIQKSDIPPITSTAGSSNPPFSRPDLLGCPNHSAPSVSSHPPPAADNHKRLTNYELLDFTMHQPQNSQNSSSATGVPSGVFQQAPPPAPGSKQQGPVSNASDFYRQVTKDAQQERWPENEPQQSCDSGHTMRPAPDSSQRPGMQSGLRVESDAAHNQANRGSLQNNQYPHTQPPGAGVFFPGSGGAQPPPYPPQPGSSSRPSSVMGGQLGYGGLPPMPGPMFGGYYGSTYPEYMDGRPPYPPQYPPADPRAQQYYQGDPYQRYDQRYIQYEGANPGYRDAERYQPREQPERSSSRASQYSDRPSSRQGYPDDYQRASRSGCDGYYADYYKKTYEYGDRRLEHYDPSAAYDPRYRSYYDQSYWYNYEHPAYSFRENYYSQAYPTRPEGYNDPWRYDPRYDASFDEDYGRQRDPYGDEYDRRSVHSEHSAHSVRTSHSQHSRRSSFSSRSQQSQVSRSQQDLVSAPFDPPSQPSLPMVYPNNVDGYQYPADYYGGGGWPAMEQMPPRPLTPEKYTVPHRCARFGPAGQMVQVLPNLPSAGQPTLVEIYSIESMLEKTEEQKELCSFPGPLVKDETHKVDVIKFAQNKSLESLHNDSLIDKDSAQLIWEFIVLLCRQNGTVVGTDIADLLLREHKSVWLPGKSPNEANLIDFNKEPLERPDDEPGSGPLSLLSDTFMSVPDSVGKETERFRELLLFGRKKDALESAMKNGLWGHALLLASKMDNRTHARVMTRFANSLPINDPLQTVYQLMSGRMPASATCCGDEKWGDWRPHLAMVLSNLTHTLDLDTRTITTMGDTLASKGLIDAAHFCYMMAQVGLGIYTKKSTKMVLIGSNHSLPFFKFASNEAIQRTEAYEYAQSLGSQPCSLPNFQVFKFIYACRLAEAGLCAQAFQYCEVIARSLLSLPSYHSPVFISQLIQISAKLRFFDPQLKEKPEQELFIEPDWLLQLRQLDSQIREGVISYSTDRTTPQQYVCSTPSSEFEQPTPPDPVRLPVNMNTGPENHLMSTLLPNPGPPLPGVQLMPPAPPTILDDSMASVSQVLPNNDGVPFYPIPPHLGSVPGPVPGSVPGPISGLVPVPPVPGQTHGALPSVPGYDLPYQAEQPYSTAATPSGVALVEPPFTLQDQQVSHQNSSQPSSPTRNTLTEHLDFYDQMASMVPGKRSRTTSQSSMNMGVGLRSRTTSESSNLSTGRERSNSAAKPSLPAPESIPEQPICQEEPKKRNKGSPKKGSGSWLGWFYRRGRNEAHLPDDKNKSIVWDEKKKRWVNLDEPEEENKPPPPPPTCFPKAAPQMGPGAPPTSGPQVNMFSRKAGTKSRYVDVLNPGGSSSKLSGSVPPPADLFAPLAPMPMPANLFVPGGASDEQQPMEGSVPDASGSQGQGLPNPSTAAQTSNQTLYPPGHNGAQVTEGTQSGELSRSSSMSSLSREVSQHLNQGPPQPSVQGAPPSGNVTFYNPSQFAQPTAPSGGARPGRFGQRKYPTLK